MNVLKNILKIIFIFILGIGGGIFADQILWPYFIERPLFQEYRLEQPAVYVNEYNEITIAENTALQEGFEKIEKSLVGIRTITKQGRIITGAGLVVTSDGLIITLNNLIPKEGNFAFFVDAKAPAYQVLKRDVENNLALIKLEDSGFSTVGFAEFGSLRFGQRVFMAGAFLEDGNVQKTVNEGVIKTYNEEFIKTNMLEGPELSGSPLFNIKGELVGLSLIGSDGKVSAVPINKIREFIGF